MGGQRFFRHGELPLLILALLDQRSMPVYRLLTALGRLFGDRYEPSTGTIYPAVWALRSEGLVEKEQDGTGKPYRLTARGRQALSARRDDLAALELRTGVRVSRDESLDAALAAFVSRVRQLAPGLDRDQIVGALDRVTEELLAATRGETS